MGTWFRKNAWRLAGMLVGVVVVIFGIAMFGQNVGATRDSSIAFGADFYTEVPGGSRHGQQCAAAGGAGAHGHRVSAAGDGTFDDLRERRGAHRPSPEKEGDCPAGIGKGSGSAAESAGSRCEKLNGRSARCA